MIRRGKILTLSLILGMFVAFASACGSDRDNNGGNEQNTTKSTGSTEKDSKGIIEDVGDGIGEGVKDIGDGIGNGIKDIGDGVQDGMNNTGNSGMGR